MADKSSVGASDSGKKREASDSVSGRKIEAFLMKTKVAIMKKLDSGEKMANVLLFFSLNILI